MPTNPWGVNATGGPVSLGSGAGSLMYQQPRPAAPAPSGQQQIAQTFTQMQRQGIARPPAPQQPVGMVPGGTMVNTAIPRPQIDPARQQQPAGGQVLPQQQPAQQQPNIMQMLLQRLGQPGTIGGNGPLGGHVVGSLLDSLANPSAYNSDQAKATFDRLNQGLSEGFDVERQKIREEMARRGLGDSTIYGGRLGDVAIQQARAQSDLAGQIAQDQAKSYASDRANAIAQALGYNQSQQGQNLANFQANQGAYRNALQDLLGYGQQSFNNQVTTQQLNNDQSAQQVQFLLSLMGMV